MRPIQMSSYPRGEKKILHYPESGPSLPALALQMLFRRQTWKKGCARSDQRAVSNSRLENVARGFVGGRARQMLHRDKSGLIKQSGSTIFSTYLFWASNRIGSQAHLGLKHKLVKLWNYKSTISKISA